MTRKSKILEIVEKEGFVREGEFKRESILRYVRQGVLVETQKGMFRFVDSYSKNKTSSTKSNSIKKKTVRGPVRRVKFGEESPFDKSIIPLCQTEHTVFRPSTEPTDKIVKFSKRDLEKIYTALVQSKAQEIGVAIKEI